MHLSNVLRSFKRVRKTWEERRKLLVSADFLWPKVFLSSFLDWVSSKHHPVTIRMCLTLTLTPVRLISCKSLQDQNLTMLHRAKEVLNQLSHGKVTQGRRGKKCKWKNVGTKTWALWNTDLMSYLEWSLIV